MAEVRWWSHEKHFMKVKKKIQTKNHKCYVVFQNLKKVNLFYSKKLISVSQSSTWKKCDHGSLDDLKGLIW